MVAKILRFAIPTALALSVAAPGARAELDPKYDPERVEIPALRPIQEIEPERYVMPNGIVVYLLENHELPRVTGTAYFKASTAWDPAEKVGLASMTGSVMRTGGSTEHDGDWIDDRLAAIGASISTSVGTENASGSFSSLSENAAEVIGLLAEIVRAPALPEDKIELAKVEARRAIAGRNDEMFPIVIRMANWAVYGMDSPYARIPEYATIEAITRDDLARFHRMAFSPDRTILALYGDFKSKDMKKFLERRFGEWNQSEVTPPEMPPIPEIGEPKLLFAEKSDVTNSGIVVTHLGFRADAPDAPDMEVVETYLGGGFQSRLFNEIRTKRGLAYATGAQDGAGFFRPGAFVAFSLTQSDSTLTALDLVRRQVERVTREAPDEEELDIAKQTVLNNFVFNFEEPAQVLFRAAFLELAGYPSDYLETYQKGLQAVTSASALAAAQSHVHPDRASVVIVGKEETFERSLESVGLPVERMDISIPPPPSTLAVGEATPEALERGREWLVKAAELAGGPEAWAGVQALEVERQGTMSVQGQEMSVTARSTWALPSRRLDVIQLPVGEIVQGTDGNAGWARAFGQTQDRPEVAAQVKKAYASSLFRLFAHPGELQVQALEGMETIDGAEYWVAYVQSDVVQDWKLYFDAQGRLVRMEYQGDGPAGPALQTEIYGEWKPVGGLQYPHSRTVLLDGDPFLSETIVSVKLNPQVDEGAFEKPAS